MKTTHSRIRGSVLVLASLTSACVVGPAAPQRPVARESIAIVTPRCAGAHSCVLGHVTTALDATPIADAAVFLLREGAEIPLQTLTDEQGVFTVVDPPPGRYRLEVFKEAAKVELAGLELGRAGTTMVPVRLELD
ncbi:carboxypeptidase-like regulatory domain-containing protein [Nannocystaceae bacterium ST9]